LETPERPRRGRTAALIGGAAALGVVAGVCTGYVVQAGRPPTELPPLSQPVVHQAKGEVEPLSAAQDRRVKTDGDLRKLLLTRPRGARDTDLSSTGDGWMSLADYAETFDKQAPAFREQLGSEFRRIAVTGWRTGTCDVEIRLVQYHQVSESAASDHEGDQEYWADRKPGTDGWPIPGTGDGRVYVHHRLTKDGDYEAEAVASRGDLLMEIWVTDAKPVPKKKIMDLAKRQVARL